MQKLQVIKTTWQQPGETANVKNQWQYLESLLASKKSLLLLFKSLSLYKHWKE